MKILWLAMDVRQLRYFISVVEAGSFTAASHRLRVAQPALSQHVLSLEKELGTRLLQREARGVRLTDSGARFIEHARIVLRELERAREAAAEAGGEISGRVAIGLPTTVTPILAAPLLEMALTSLPRVTLHLLESHSGFLREWLDSSRLDLALLFNVADADGLDLQPLVVETLHLISAPQIGPKAETVTLAQLHTFDLFLASQSHDLRNTLDDAIFLTTKRKLQVKAEIDSVSTIKQMVMSGLGYTILPSAAIQAELSKGLLSARRIVRPTLARHASIATLSRRPKTRAQQAVARLIVETTNTLIDRGIWSAKRAPIA
ncbi:LysR family transcriptional regulator [Bradyrhizobium sp. CCGUVB1N3]|uniref:LysR family transcriptional regulator n=1 Tax=Bradyrhizobium sp. CCGUVB1N3 TaxID=2949629 RepID=UPI0020B27592|nr:LysR family transcriptional regulator [Bradyrhizobium sp. CCGUVB1N3]MCP3471069.1 LysR family transcriptional regulator [Bradyrhizobium sp. CCGUVB1N3]